MKHKKLILRIITAVLAVAAVVLSIVYINYDRSMHKSLVDLYFLNEEGTGIVSEPHTLRYKGTNEIISEALEQLQKGPSNSKLNRVVTKRTAINSIQLNETGGVLVDFSKEFLSENSAHNVLAAYAVVKTLCSTGIVNSVKVTTEGKAVTDREGNELDYIAATDINLETEEYSSDMQKVVLYFESKKGTSLEKEERTIKVTDLIPVEEYIINELIKGPQSNSMQQLLSKKTVLVSVDVEDNICYLNFKSSFIKDNAGNSGREKLIIYSIVNSLTELETINRVQFYMDGKRAENFGSVPIKECISRNTAIISTKN